MNYEVWANLPNNETQESLGIFAARSAQDAEERAGRIYPQWLDFAAAESDEPAEHEDCKRCGAINCLKHCPCSEDGKHVPDPGSFSFTDGYSDERMLVADLNCKLCGQSGSISVSLVDVNWE
jgi:hypothetical protein